MFYIILFSLYLYIYEKKFFHKYKKNIAQMVFVLTKNS
ncbi:Uncharacterized protein dnm_089960 [Desulfonema magnum]|uniref:Uncharacterized protein n=1 Tax=Desulfonema magnum TaxID=45655 RepID=A0A975BWE6_9BACT|nr:Uncharacterized protein dnm_089960 [Desulfonema magnum]